jgi:hypothetical protein
MSSFSKHQWAVVKIMVTLQAGQIWADLGHHRGGRSPRSWEKNEQGEILIFH